MPNQSTPDERYFADDVALTPSGRLFTYSLEPAPLAVGRSADSNGDITIRWPGSLDINRFLYFFESASEQVCRGRSHKYRRILATDSGPEIEYFTHFEQREQFAMAAEESGFVRLECIVDADEAEPVLTGVVNLDRNAKGLENLSRAVSIKLNYSDLPFLGSHIVSMMTSTYDVLFSTQQGYEADEVYGTLASVMHDMTVALTDSSTPPHAMR